MIQDNVRRIRERIAEACSRSNRHPDEITIIAVTKGRTLSDINEAIEAGITDIGENRVQEALLKHNSPGLISSRAIKWQMVGHLQTNKARSAVKIFGLIQSVDSITLAVQIDKEAARINKIQDILIEVKTSPEATKFGLNLNDTFEVIKEISKLKNINIKGLMTIAPIVDIPESARPYFRILKELRDKINESQVLGQRLQVLSMGMTDDFEVAIEEGATMVRLGRAIFEC